MLSTELAKAIAQVPSTILYAAIGIAMFGASFWLLAKIVPFSIRKEIEEDQNIALGIMIGAMFLGIAYIIGSTISGP